MSKDGRHHFVIVGGGLAGSLLAVYLGRKGYRVDVYEMRDDIRGGNVAGGKSINLALTRRGIDALAHAGLAEQVLASAVPMKGRLIHSESGDTSLQPYGKDDTQLNYSVSRAGLNAELLEAADSHESVTLHFNKKCTGVDLDEPSVTLADTVTGVEVRVEADVIVSADGAFSAVRARMQKLARFNYSQQYLEHGYKELEIPPGVAGEFQIEKNALHIWPRRSYMMIALPNLDGSFTCTLFWPFDGPFSFDNLESEEDVRRFFEEHFADAVPVMPTLTADYLGNPTNPLATICCGPWHYQDKVVLLGDACHAVVPFYGQGMNAAFEDVLVLDACMDKHKSDFGAAFAAYYSERKEHVDVLQRLCVDNFVEMRDHTGSKWFLLRKKTEKMLSKIFPSWYVPLYNMVTHTRIRYVDAVRRARMQKQVCALVAGFLVIAVFLLLFT